MNNSYLSGHLLRYGYTNREMEDLGAMAVPPPPSLAFALCPCGHAERDRRFDDCQRCGHALFWERRPKSIAESVILRHQRRYSSKTTNQGVHNG